MLIQVIRVILDYTTISILLNDSLFIILRWIFSIGSFLLPLYYLKKIFKVLDKKNLTYFILTIVPLFAFLIYIMLNSIIID